MLSKSIKEFLETIPQDFTKIEGNHGSEHNISSKIVELIKQKGEGYTQSVEDTAEQIAFDFIPNYFHEENNGWGSYYGPYWILPDEKGIMMEYPSKSKVTSEIIHYWKIRAEESNIEICKYRYADLVIDFGEKEDYYKMSQILIGSGLLIIENLYDTPLNLITKAKRIVNIALSINDKSLIERIIKALIHLEEIIGEDEFPGLWGFCMSELVLNKKLLEGSYLKPPYLELIVSDMQNRMNRIARDNLNSLERATSLLSNYYALIEDEVSLLKVLSFYEKAIRDGIEKETNAILISSQFEQLQNTYLQYRRFHSIEKEYKRIVKEIGNLSLNWENSLKKISSTVKIEKEDIDKFLDSIFIQGEELEILLGRFFINGVHKKSESEKRVIDFMGEFPLQYLFGTDIIGPEGLIIGEIPPINGEKPSKEHILRQYSQDLSIGGIFLEFIVGKLQEDYKSQDLIDFLSSSLIYKDEEYIYIRTAIEEYWNKNYLVAASLFVGILERGFRNFVKETGGSVLELEKNKYNGYDFRTLGTLINENSNKLDSIFGYQRNELSFYYRFVLIEKLGMNLRNNWSHGINRKAYLYSEASNRLFHLIIGLALIKMQPNKNPPK